LNSPNYSDVIFVFPDEKKIYAHACILASRSPVLLSLLVEAKKQMILNHI